MTKQPCRDLESIQRNATAAIKLLTDMWELNNTDDQTGQNDMLMRQEGVLAIATSEEARAAWKYLDGLSKADKRMLAASENNNSILHQWFGPPGIADSARGIMSPKYLSEVKKIQKDVDEDLKRQGRALAKEKIAEFKGQFDDKYCPPPIPGKRRDNPYLEVLPPGMQHAEASQVGTLSSPPRHVSPGATAKSTTHIS